MKSGEKYLNISLTVGKALELAQYAKIAITEGKTHIAIPAFPRYGDKGPSFAGDGVAVWEQVKKENAPETTEEQILDEDNVW